MVGHSERHRNLSEQSSSARRMRRAWIVPCGLAVLMFSALLLACTPSRAAPGGVSTRSADLPAEHRQPGAVVGLQVGQRAPAFTVATLDAKPLTRADLLAQERPFILYFFASW